MSVGKNFKIWDGIQDEWPEEMAEQGFSDNSVLERMVKRMQDSIKKVELDASDSRCSIYSQYPLSILIAALGVNKKITVVDFGGGLGQTFLSLKASLPDISHLDYFVVEFSELAQQGKDLFSSEDQIKFVEDLDQAPDKCDIIFLGSTFQYIDDWESLLARFERFNSKFIVFGNLLAGDIKPFVTFQNNYGHKIPIRFHNFNEIVGVLKGHGFDVTFSAFHEQIILGEKQKLPLDNFPKDRRLSYGRNVIFERQ